VIPTFSEITNGLVLTGAAPHPVMLQEHEGFTISAAVLEAALQNGPDAIFLGRPNSPTGDLLDLDPLIGLIRECERRCCWCVLDEAFIDFAGEKQSAVRLAARSKRTIILRSMTKMFAIPGIRLGYLVAHKEVVNRFRDAIEPWSVSSLAEQIGIKCLDEAADFVRHSIAFTYSEREFMVGAIAQIKGFRPFRSAANFLMFRVDEHRPHQFGDNCRVAGLAVRDLSKLPGAGPGLYRISIRSGTTMSAC